MVKSTTHSTKSNLSTAAANNKMGANTNSYYNKSAAASRSQSRRQSMAESMRKAYGEVKKKGLCKHACVRYTLLLLTNTFEILKGDAIPTRFVIVFIAALANTLSYIMRTNMSVTIVAMVNHTRVGNSSDTETCLDDGENSTTPHEHLVGGWGFGHHTHY